MLCNTAALLDEDEGRNDGWKELTQYMTVVESFLIHTRSLLGFLYPPKRMLEKNKRKAGEVYALDYCNPSWRGRPWKEITSVRATIRRDIVQLSLARLPVARSGEYARVVAALKAGLSSFLDDAERLSAGAKTQLRAALERSGGSAGKRADAAHLPMPIPAIPVPSRSASDGSRS